MILNKLYLLILFLIPLSIAAQKIETPTFQTDSIIVDSSAKKWTLGGGLGFDATAVTLINPRLNEGEGRINLGALFDFYANYQGKRLLWNNKGSIQMGLTKDGTDDWSKSNDALLYNTQVGLRIKGNWFAAGMIDIQTQVLNTYQGKYIRRFNDFDTTERPLTSRCFAPASIKLAPGILYKPNNRLSMMLSAISTKAIIVSDPTLASQGDSTLGASLLGNTWTNAQDFSQFSSQFGAELRIDYNAKFANDKLSVNSTLDFYSNYLLKPENIACEWLTSIDVSLTNHFSVNLRSDWFYDHNVLVQIGSNPDNIGRRVFIRNTFFLKFNKTF